MKHIVRYPKLLLFSASIVLSYVLLKMGAFHWIEAHLDGANYASVLLGGMLFTFGFTSPLAAAYFYEVAHIVDPLPAALLAAAGAMATDMSILRFTKSSVGDEIVQFKRTAILRKIHALFHHKTISDQMRNVTRWAIACIIIGSPLPDEIGIALLIGVTKVDGWRFALLSFVMNTVGIFVIFSLGRMAV